MKETPILYSGDMVRADLDDLKHMTRRVVKPCSEATIVGRNDAGQLDNTVPRERPQWVYTTAKCPYGVPGDRLWVKETWAPLGDFVGLDPGVQAITQGCFYRADHPTGVTNNDGSSLRWHSGRFMFKKYARIWRELTEVRVERVQEISEDDAIAEGIRCVHFRGLPWFYYTARGGPSFETAKEAFAGLWDLVNAKRGYSWESNPWVWGLSSRRVNGNEVHSKDDAK